MGKFLTDSWHFYQTPPPHPDPLQVLNTFMIVKNSQVESAISAVVQSFLVFLFFFSNFWLHKKVIYPPPPTPKNKMKMKTYYICCLLSHSSISELKKRKICYCTFSRFTCKVKFMDNKSSYVWNLKTDGKTLSFFHSYLSSQAET